MKRKRFCAPLSLFSLCLCASVVSFLAGCQQKMADQPSYRPLRPSDFFDDGRSARPLVPGTVPYSATPEDSRLVSGRVQGRVDAVEAAALVGVAGERLGPLAAAAMPPRPEAEYVTAFPFPIAREDLERGKERYTIFCSVCHDAAGTGHGKIVERGYTMPPSYHTSYSRGLERRGVKILLRDAPVGYYFEVISKGYGAMPDYATQVPPEDRWRIIAYIRTLQYSRHAPLEDLSEAERKQATRNGTQ
jgi:mono/diheme cytochrome c family protein